MEVQAMKSTPAIARCPHCGTDFTPGHLAALIEALEAALRVSHQNCLALWEALEGGASPRCRDCADFDGRCQGNGPACDPQERALERIKALRSLEREK
jgi:hypothetical protein